jgi:hypothetical protein
MMIWNACQNILRSTLLVTCGAFVLASGGNAATIYGGDTSVALDTSTLSALTGLGFSIAPIAPATVSGGVATFPITGGDTTTVINHSGGLAFTQDGTTADIENFVINLSTDTLTGDLVAGGSTTPNFTFFDIGAGDVLTLDSALAGGLSTVYGIPNLTGATIGTATVSPVLTPEPATISLAALGLLAAASIGRQKRKISN